MPARAAATCARKRNVVCPATIRGGQREDLSADYADSRRFPFYIQISGNRRNLRI